VHHIPKSPLFSFRFLRLLRNLNSVTLIKALGAKHSRRHLELRVLTEPRKALAPTPSQLATP
jgi:hypothetical protein